MILSVAYMLDKSDGLSRVKYDGKEIGFQMEQLYIEVLYTIANTVGASTGQYAHYKEDLYRYAQEAFGVPQDQHRRYLNIASEEKVCQFTDSYRDIARDFLAKNVPPKYHSAPQ